MNIFGYNVRLVIESNKPEKIVVAILKKELGKFRDETSQKIRAIKLLRRLEVSKILIDAGVVPEEDIRSDEFDASKKYVGLAFAKSWVEEHYFHTK